MNAEDVTRRGDLAKLRRIIDSLAPLAEMFADEKIFNSIAYKYFEPIEQGIYTARLAAINTAEVLGDGRNYPIIPKRARKHEHFG